MEVLLNDKSIAMQFTEDTFMEYIKNEVLPIGYVPSHWS